MRKLVSGFAAVAFFALGPAAVDAQVQLGPTVAFHDDFDFGIGATGSAQAPQLGEGIGFMADFIWFFPSEDGFDYFEINGNVTYEFPIEDSTVLPFALGGLNIARLSADTGFGDVSDTEIGLNLGGGVTFDAGDFRPTAGARVELSGGEGFVVFFTLPFEVGGS